MPFTPHQVLRLRFIVAKVDASDVRSLNLSRISHKTQSIVHQLMSQEVESPSPPLMSYKCLSFSGLGPPDTNVATAVTATTDERYAEGPGFCPPSIKHGGACRHPKRFINQSKSVDLTSPLLS
ncbi:hypothetical protein TcWFU_004143 [Taenia crassiceps]|uniref:Uncharacterized protein n=1 Tax=Taenia crassiceps TaxID=6207 RepID=A0ABR4Q9D7_9CEST